MFCVMYPSRLERALRQSDEGDRGGLRWRYEKNQNISRWSFAMWDANLGAGARLVCFGNSCGSESKQCPSS